MRILVTGGNGLVGSACQRYAKKDNYDITIVSRKEPLFSGIKSYKSLQKISEEKINYDLLIHCSAATPNNSNFDSILELNTIIDKELCNFISNGLVKRVVYLSTMAVYGDINVEVLNEKYEINNPNLYGYSKFLGENKVKETCRINDVSLAIIRLPGVVGKNMPLIFFRRLYESILNGVEVTIRSRESLFNNAIFDSDVFLTSLNIFKKQKEKFILLNHHSKDTITLGKLLDDFSEVIRKPCIYRESSDCNPPFLIKNTINDDLLFKSEINKMIINFHSSYE